MHDAVLVRFLQCRGNLRGERDYVFLRQRASPELLGEDDAADVFHHQEVYAALGVEVENSGDVRVAQLRERQGFVAEAAASGFVRQRAGREELQGDVAV